MLGGEDLPFFLFHRQQVFQALQDLDAAESTKSYAITGLSETEADLDDGIQQICFMNDTQLAA